MQSFEPGKKAYIVINNREVSEVTIVKKDGDFYVIRFASGGGIQLRENRLFANHLEASKALPAKEPKKRQWVSHYDYGL